MAVAVLALEPSASPGVATITEDTKVIPLTSASGEAVVHSVVLVEENNWRRPNPTTLVAPRSLGGVLAMRIFETTRNLDLATEIQDYDGILSRKFGSNVDYSRLVNVAAGNSKLSGFLQQYNFDLPSNLSSVNLSNVWDWMSQVNQPSVVWSSPIPAMLPILLALSGGNQQAMRDVCRKIFPQDKRAFDNIVLSVQSVCASQDDLEQVIQSSIQMLRFGPWGVRVRDLQRIFPKAVVGGGLSEDQKENLRFLLEKSVVLVNAGNEVLANAASINDDIVDKIVTNDFPAIQEVVDAADLLRALTI